MADPTKEKHHLNHNSIGDVKEPIPETQHLDPEKGHPGTRHTAASFEDAVHYERPPETAKDLITEVIHAVDDPSLNPWTFRTWFLGKMDDLNSIYDLISLGIGLATFGGILATIYHFKPQVVVVSTVFLAVIAYVLGDAMDRIIPRNRWLNPHPVSNLYLLNAPLTLV